MRSFAPLLCVTLACARPQPDPPSHAPASAPVSAPAPALDLLALDVTQAQAMMASGELSSRALVEASLARIAALDDAGPQLAAVLALNPAALDEADARDRERAAGQVRGPLHGIPVLLKDNIDATPMPTTAGSLALAEHRPPRDAFVVARLREQGAVMLGKTNLSEWANFRSHRSSSGWSSVGGQTRNPHVLDRSPCGSSSGSGVARPASRCSPSGPRPTAASSVRPPSTASSGSSPRSG